MIEFSGGEKPGEVTAISFGSKELVRGVTTGSLFDLNVTVVTTNGGRPYAFKLHTADKKPGESGTATLVQKDKVTTLTVRGQNDMKETITLVVSCATFTFLSALYLTTVGVCVQTQPSVLIFWMNDLWSGVISIS